MRIIAGIRRGHPIRGSAGARDLRPTSDKVREAIFNILGDEVEGRDVLDLFAGTGALGLEALSRGAASATFVERRREHLALIRRNLGDLRLEGLGEAIAGDAFAFASTFEPTAVAGPMLAFVDPPYREYQNRPSKVRALLADLDARLPGGSIIVAESGAALDGSILPERPADHRRYGDTHVAIIRT